MKKLTTLVLTFILFCCSLSACIDMETAVNDKTSNITTSTTTASAAASTTTLVPSTATTTTTTTKSKTITASHAEQVADMVWIPQSGKKYHSKSNCSNMKNPAQVTLEEAIHQGYDPCKRCYK